MIPKLKESPILVEFIKVKNRKIEPIWIELSKSNYRDYLNELRVVTMLNSTFLKMFVSF